jgi:hypothetical protein
VLVSVKGVLPTVNVVSGIHGIGDTRLVAYFTRYCAPATPETLRVPRRELKLSCETLGR